MRRLVLFVAALELFLLAPMRSIVVGQPPPDEPLRFSLEAAVLVTRSQSGGIEIRRLQSEEAIPSTTPQGLLVWKTKFGAERWEFLRQGGVWPDEDAVREPLIANTASRTGEMRGVGGAVGIGMLAATIQLEPLDGTTLARGAAFITPQHGAELISNRPTFRRAKSEKGESDSDLPAATATVTRNGSDEVVLRIPFSKGQADVVFGASPDWPKSLAAGLPPGRYTIRLEKGLEANSFTVLDDSQRRPFRAPIDAMAKLVVEKNDPLPTLFAVEQLLTHLDDEGRPRFLSDALDVVESFPEKPLPGALARHRDRLREWLANVATDPDYQQGRVGVRSFGRETGIKLIDDARRLIADGQWTEAEKVLEEIEATSDEPVDLRTRGLKTLYRAVILAEAAAGRADDAARLFDDSIATLSKLPAGSQREADLLRAYNNAANFHLVIAQNCLGNHSFQLAAGLQGPILKSLLYLIEARRQFGLAEKLAADQKDFASRDAIRVNHARAVATIADIIRSLDVPLADEGRSERQFVEGEKAAADEAIRIAMPVVAEKSAATEPLTQAAAFELLAQVAYRQRDFRAVSEYGVNARKLFLGEGDIAGVETIERLMGLAALAASDRDQAFKHFSIAQLIAELQRSRFPQDQTGQARAGYFARHNVIYEKLVELHLDAGRPHEALRLAEQAKARAAQDFLGSIGVEESYDHAAPRDFDELLANWPADVTAVEYFLGAERGWGFVIQSGKVTAFQLRNSSGQPVTSRQLIADVRKFQSTVDGYKDKLRNSIHRGLDKTWQDKLFELRSTLLPDDVVAEMRKSSRVLIVPQHILHYVPFAALVTRRDEAKRAKFEMVSPRFILDEPFSITVTPSLMTWDLISRRDHEPILQVHAVGVGDAGPHLVPLPGVKTDLDNLRAVYTDKVKRVVSDNEATVRTVFPLLSEPGLLMFASHGNNVPERPAESHLHLIAEPLESNELQKQPESLSEAIVTGRLTAKCIFSTRINARLVVLSACYSGLGDASPLPGDDLFGLQRAFLYGGARSVVSGLWDVDDDSAPILIRRFHELVRDGEIPSKALAVSQREFLNKLRATADPADIQLMLHPYFWSMFCVAGAD